MKRAALGVLFLVGALGLTAAAARVPEATERLYSRGFYPALSRGLSGATGVLPFSLAEALLPIVVAAGGFRLRKAWRDRRERGALRAGASLGADGLLAGGVVAAAFVVGWGLHYHRQPFGRSAGLDTRPASVPELRAVAEFLAGEADRLREGQEEDAQGVFAVAGGARSVLERAGRGFARAAEANPLLQGSRIRPKPLVLSRGVSYLGLTGIYSPFTGEANVNVDVPVVELPFAASHEAAHQRGFAREDEASFVGYLACRAHPDPDFNYAGTLAASVHAANALYGVDREGWQALEERRSPAVRRDLKALRDWAARYEGPASRASERVNDAYLKAQGQADGVRSYGRMVDLLIAERRGKATAAPLDPRPPGEAASSAR